MGLFGRKKPQELYAEAERYVKLVADWLKQPMEPLRSMSAADRVTAEYYTLAVCTYLAQEKVSPGGREYLAEAVVRNSTYSSYVTDLKKECGFMAVLLNVLKTSERDARKSRGNVLQALVDTAFKDFGSYKEKDTVKRVVYAAINLFVKEIETTNYKGMSLPVPAQRTADYVFHGTDGGLLYFDKAGDAYFHGRTLYQPLKQQGSESVLFVEAETGAIVRDNTLIQELIRIYKDRLSRQRPTHVTLSNDKGQTQQRKIMGWMEFGGKEYAITTDMEGKKSIMVLVRGQDGHLSGISREESGKIFAIFRDRHPSLFK